MTRPNEKRPNDKQKIVDHYDFVSPYYRALWGEHLHHGYWIRGDETKEQAQTQLVEHLAQAAQIRRGLRILDVGCGFGGSSIYLARQYAADVTGITISPVQVEMASEAAAREHVRARFLLMDAESMALDGPFDEPFDVIWTVESVAHYERKDRFFARAAALLKPAGTLALVDWFQRENLSPEDHSEFIDPIQKGMLVELRTVSEYKDLMVANGLQPGGARILNSHCAKTWDICLELIKNKALWELAARRGPEFVQFLQGFRAMRAGFRSGSFVYALMIAKKA